MGPRLLFTAAATAYLLNCGLGVSVATGAVHTGRFRWVHHALYIVTSILAGTAAGVTLLRRARGAEETDARPALALLPAAVPLTLIPRISARTRGHAALALVAAPFYAAALVLAWRK
ncbi:hypothetical protein SCB71_06635 [Herbiconiux sp. KACC 21604]|uniref:hypothetical protein n=1 Tax=unclassified Herbiconiux TaxID=2618217 RepID=UPI0014929010|nr:hypothetical protein [Herbiconiux sp. SALV-R1]QJU52987.1 hypothetical protein HL652_04615 [Herbiconiux sp. SALV-R1]WPO87916.1 hypothetical protein SCB71_06635 [Herbiconiux sp. KACC 21604]